MKNLLLCISIILSGTVYAATQAIIPKPAEYIVAKGEFSVPSRWIVNSQLPVKTTETLLKYLKHPADISSNLEPNLILREDPVLGDEAYALQIQPTNIIISASSEKGFFYALQSLYQLCYRSVGSDNKLPCGIINDFPRFSHRGLMLDVARFFIPKEEVLKLIDVASTLKINTLHMHLTDDNGWRMEIKKYPKLTEVGAWRVDRPEIFPGRMNQQNADEPTPIGGFYTQDELREIVAYAADRHINVIPEIEMPAHAAAAIASYPELACPVVDKFVGVFPGIGGPDASIIMCAGNENVYQFYKDVIDEVIDIFPSHYIHLGGDEANKHFWEICDLCNAKVSELGLENFEELQAYFMDTINSYVRSKGRTAMGWDEVTYGNPKEDMVILGWQGDGNIAVRDAKKSGRNFIMTPAKTLYLIRYQGPQWFEPITYFGNNTLTDLYSYEPVKDDWSPELEKQLLGVQGSLWTEFCNNVDDVEYLIFPRLLAVADMAWRQKDTQNWDAFIEALDNFVPELENRDINYALSMYNIQHKASPNGNGVTLTLTTERPDVDILYSLGNENEETILYSSPLSITEPTVVFASTFKDGKQMGKTLKLDIDFNNATGNPVSAKSRNGIAEVLTNGIRGSNRNSDFEWAGWYGTDAEFIVDLQEIKNITNGKIGALAASNLCVALPESVLLLGSEDGENFFQLAETTVPQELIYNRDSLKYDIDFGEINKKARYLKVVAKNPGNIPDGFPRAKNPAWLYFDEIIIN